MNITCSRKLSLDEIEELAGIAKLMDRQNLIKDWTGDGMLYKTTKRGHFHFIDQDKLHVNVKGGRKNVSV